MKNLCFVFIIALAMCAILQGCKAGSESADGSQPPEASGVDAQASVITKETAYEGVNNYCHSTYDWSIAEKNPDIMYVAMGDETESEYQVIFRSYTGAFVRFSVDKSSGIAKMTEYVPSLDVEEDAGTIDLHDYLTPAAPDEPARDSAPAK